MSICVQWGLQTSLGAYELQSYTKRVPVVNDVCLLSNWQLKGGHFSQKQKFRALLPFRIIDKPYLKYPVGPRRKTTESFVNYGYNYPFFLSPPRGDWIYRFIN